MKYLSTALLATLAALSTASGAMAQTQDRQGPPIAEMAADLGVTEAALQTCMPRPSGERGERPSKAEHEARLGEIASCLQSAGSSVTPETLDTVMSKYRPQPRGNG